MSQENLMFFFNTLSGKFWADTVCRKNTSFQPIPVSPLTTQENNNTSIAKSAGVVGLAVMFSRVLGLVREQVFAALFGAGYAGDAFIVAFRIPNLLRDLFGEGALSAAFVAVFSDYESNRSKEETRLLACNVLCFFAILLSIVSLLGCIFADQIVGILAPDFSLVAGKTALTVWLTRIMLPFLICISLAAVVMGMLNTRGRFFVPALASSFFNLGSIVCGGGLALVLPRYGYPAIVGMAIGTLCGGFLQFAIQLPSLYRTGFRFTPRLRLRDPGLLRIVKLMAPATIGLSAVQLNIFINTNFASSCAEGSISWLNYAFRLVQLPIGIFGVALSIAMMPVLAKQAAKKNISAMRSTLMSSLVMVLALTIPATAGLLLLAEEIIRLIFEQGAFSSEDTIATAATLSCYAVGLFAYSANKVMVPAFYAINKPSYPVIASFLAVLLNIVFIRLTIDSFQHLAIAASTSATMVINFIFLLTILSNKTGGLPLSYLFRGLIKIVAATLVLVAVVFGCLEMLEGFFAATKPLQICALLLTISLAVVVYGAFLHLVNLKEAQQLTSKIRSYLR